MEEQNEQLGERKNESKQRKTEKAKEINTYIHKETKEERHF